MVETEIPILLFVHSSAKFNIGLGPVDIYRAATTPATI